MWPSNFGLMPKCTQSSRKIKKCYKSAAVTQYLAKRENHPLLTARWIFEMINVSAVCPNFWSFFDFFCRTCLYTGALSVRTERESSTKRNPRGKPTNTWDLKA